MKNERPSDHRSVQEKDGNKESSRRRDQSRIQEKDENKDNDGYSDKSSDKTYLPDWIRKKGPTLRLDKKDRPNSQTG